MVVRSVRDIIILTIRPEFAFKIFSGEKTIELRRKKPINIKSGSIVLVYVSSPVKSLWGAFEVDDVKETALGDLWDFVKDRASVSIDEFNKYFTGVDHGVSILIKQVWKFKNPIKLDKLRQKMNWNQPPQSFRYANKKEHLIIKKIVNRFQYISSSE